ncbi:unnamed protein product [Gongylonema pulchrum]|uniref:Myosin motor domain-containing protein n=1 Tax=Gongylonema pulchrum TaxID=637853 RepID=A0A183EDI0_9BILA|nr:unnamed protein product [Gongylonema pulchrum]
MNNEITQEIGADWITGYFRQAPRPEKLSPSTAVYLLLKDYLQKQQFSIRPFYQPCYVSVRRGIPRSLKKGNLQYPKEQWSDGWLASTGGSAFQMKCFKANLA